MTIDNIKNSVIPDEDVKANPEYWWVNYIPALELSVLKQSCFSLGITTTENFEGINYVAAHLRCFEKEDKPNIPTTMERVYPIKNAIDASNKLRAALDAIHDYDNCGSLRRARFNFDVEFNRLQKGLLESLAHVEGASKLGRRALLGDYSISIGDLWKMVDGQGFVLGRNNNFHKLCDAVFLAAGVPAKAEGALRRYLSKGESLA